MPRLRIRPIVAHRALRRLRENPDDTAQAIVVIAALAGGSGPRLFRRFRRSPRAAAILQGRHDLYAPLADLEGLQAMPPGSLGRTIGDWFAREAIGAAGLAQAALAARSELGAAVPASDEEQVFTARLLNLHDVFHVLTGYDRDLRGEAAVLAFTLAQTSNSGIAYLLLDVLRRSGWRSEMGRLIREGFRRGLRSTWLLDQDWEALLPRPLSALRQELGVGEPRPYEQVRSSGAPPLPVA